METPEHSPGTSKVALMTDHPGVVILHDNPEWIPPLRAAFEARSIPVTEWLLGSGAIDLSAAPPEAVYFSRLSASAHTRGRTHAKEEARAVLSWLAAHGRTVINGRGVLELEVSKVAQHLALQGSGIEVPRTVAVLGREQLVEQATAFGAPFITKHNQGGKGLGVRRFDTIEEFSAHVASEDFEEPVDGITLLQELLVAAEPFVTRAEFVGGDFVYAVRVDTSAGSFELCPAEACAIPTPGEEPAPLFSLREGAAELPIIEDYRRFLAANDISIAGIEFIETVDGRLVTYDVNTNTNYSPDVEASSPVSGPARIAELVEALAGAEASR